MVTCKLSGRLFGLTHLLALLVDSTFAFNLYPFVDSTALAQALNISTGCVSALNDTVACDNDLFQWTVTVDDHWWETDNLTTLCTAGCTASAQTWNTDVTLACVDDDLVVQGSLVPAATVAGRFWDGLQVACLQSTSNGWCQAESQTWVGSDVVRPDCSVEVDDPSCLDPANVTAENSRLSNLYSDELLCSDCFVKLFSLRLSSDYLPDSDHSDYLVAQFQDIQDVCSTSVGAISTRAFGGFAPAFPTVTSNVTSTTDTATLTAATTTAATTTSVPIATPTPTQTGMISSCDSFYLVGAGDDCFDIAVNHSISLEDFYTWNSDVTDDCAAGLWAGYYYCVGIEIDPSLLTSSDCQVVDFSYGVSSKDATTACQQVSQLWNLTTGDVQYYTGGSEDCYSDTPICMPAPCHLVQVGTGESCASIAASLSSTAMNVTAQMFLSWNPHIMGSCDNITANQFVCASAPGGSYQPPPNAPSNVLGGGQERGGPGGSDPTAITGTSISILVTASQAAPTAAPSPTQAGSIVSTCNQYDQVEAGDTCVVFAARNGIAASDLYAWNTVLGVAGANCQTQLWVGYYYCIGVVGEEASAGVTITTTAPTVRSSSTTTTTTTTSTPTTRTTSTSAAVPSPTQPGSIIASCNKYAEALSGTYCSLFASDNGITTAQLYAWNSVLGANGENCGTAFFAGYYYCVGISS